MAKTERKTENLEWTGERYLPYIEGEIAAEHLHRYALARELVQGKDVLDIACGEGYGSNLLSEAARSVVGVDLDEGVIKHARRRYVRPALKFKVGSCAAIPLEDKSVDVVVSFETIEHHGQHEEMLNEIKRVLRPDGQLIISSPDKHEYSDVPGSVNPYHVKELYLDEFQALLKARFRNAVLYGQRVNYGSFIAPIDPGTVSSWYTFAGSSDNIRCVSGVEGPLYFIAIASDGPLVSLPAGIFSDPESLLRKDKQIAALDHNGQVLNKVVTDRDNQLTAYKRQAEEYDHLLKAAHGELSGAHSQIGGLNAAIADRDGQLVWLTQEVANRDEQLSGINSALAGRDGQLAVYQLQADQYESLLKNANGELNAARAQIASLNGILADRDGQLAAYERQSEQYESRLKSTNGEWNAACAQIASLNGALADRDGHLAVYQRQVQEMAEMLTTAHNDLNIARMQIVEMSKTITDRENHVATLIRAVTSRDSRIATHQSQAGQFISTLGNALNGLNAARSQIALLNQALADRDIQVASLSHSLAKRDEQLNGTNAVVVDRDNKLAEYKRRAEEFGTLLENANGELNISRAEIVSLGLAMADLNHRFDFLNQLVAERDGQLRALSADIANANSTIAAMASSRSWRLTSPLRKAKHSITNRLQSSRHPIEAPYRFQAPENPPVEVSESDIENEVAGSPILMAPCKSASDVQAVSASEQNETLRADTGIQIPISPDPMESLESMSSEKAASVSALSERGIAATGRERFDAEFYLRLYPDVRENYVGDPYEHFVAHGKSEGRLGFLPSLEYSGDFNRLNPDRDTVLVVSHEASTTGAPVLSLNIIWELKTKYNVIVLLLNGGSLLSDLQTSADIVVGPLGRHADTLLRYQMDDLLARCRILFALVNSVESRIVLPELARNFVPSVALIHEFASNTRPRNAIEEAIFWASETIFSADIVRDNAVSAFPDLSRRLPAVIPQGRCSRVLTSPDELSSMRDVERIRQTFRPAGWPEDTPVVLGVGSVHIRKGVDLFVACAARVAQSLRCRFVWIGSGYDPDIDKEYSAYLEDQIERAGLTDRFAFMRETSRIDFAYENSDILVVSSRLDPLPNVSIDAVSRGLPIVCFDKATGIADILRKNGLGKECVASYLDVESLALCVIAFLENPELRRSVGSRLKDIAEQTFNMTTYVAQIEKIALGGVYRAGQECLDYATIAENPDLDLDYLMGPRAAKFGKDESIRRFIRSWENGFLMRKPYSGFHPGIYMERCGIANLESNPFAHYLRAGSPEGPWSYEVLGPLIENSKVHTLPNLSVALHLHIFYPDLAPAIIDRLNANGVRPDLFVSVSSEMARNEIEILFRAYEGKTIDIQVVPNRGRDIGAFLTVFGDRITSQYEIVGHFHTKKTEELGNDAMGKAWFNFLLENLIGGRHNMVDTILGAMASNPSIGLVFPDEPHVVGWTDNRESAKCLAEKMGLPIPQVEYFNFPVGTMFWARSSAILPLIALKLDWNDYPAEPLASDGTVLHAIERLLPFLSDAAGLRSLLTSVPGVTR